MQFYVDFAATDNTIANAEFGYLLKIGNTKLLYSTRLP